MWLWSAAHACSLSAVRSSFVIQSAPAAWAPCCYRQPNSSVEACSSAPAPSSCGNPLKIAPVLLQPGDALPLLRVNFDPALVRLLREVRYFLLLSNLPMAVPDNALKVKCCLSLFAGERLCMQQST